MSDLDNLGFYTLAGAPKSPRDLIDEVRDAEQLGLGWCFISERFNIKEAATLSGAVGAVSARLQIATGATNHNTRHPMVTAAYATTMHRLTGGRFTLGLGRGIAPMMSALGLPPMEGHDVGAVLLHGHQRLGEVKPELVGELLAPLHHQLRLGRAGEPHRAERPGAETVARGKPSDANDGSEL